jgi:hypothetical protein
MGLVRADNHLESLEVNTLLTYVAITKIDYGYNRLKDVSDIRFIKLDSSISTDNDPILLVKCTCKGNHSEFRVYARDFVFDMPYDEDNYDIF